MRDYRSDPHSFVEENQELLVRILKQGDSEFVRGLAIAVLTEYGDEPALEDVERELRRARDGNGGEA